MHRIQNRVATGCIAAILSIALLGGSLFLSTPKAHAASNEEIKTLITSLLAQIANLQAILAERTSAEGGFLKKDITVGSTVVTTDMLKVRGSAGTDGLLVGVKQPSINGKVLYGPKTVSGYTWWYVEFEDNAVDGWVAANWLHAVDNYTAPLTNKNNAGTTTPTSPSIKIASPNSGNYLFGDTLTIKWDQAGEVPKGSKACVVLRNLADYKEFAFPPEGGCLSVAGAEPQSSVSGKLVRTTGYYPAEGKYRVIVTVTGPSVDGKEGVTLAVGKSASYIILKEGAGSQSAGIASVTNEKNPLITGLANGVNEVVVSVHNSSGDKVYGTASIPVVNGQWSHRVTTDLTDGSYVFKTFANNILMQEFGSTILLISSSTMTARFKAALNGVVVKAIPDVTKQTAADSCKTVYNDYATYNFKGGDVLECYWNAQKFLTLDSWKG